MSNVRNSVQLIGHLGADPELKTLERGVAMARLRIATTESYKTASGEWKDETQWHSVTLWEGLATKAAKQLQKGSFVLVQGKLINRNYVDAQGVKKYATEIRGVAVISLDKSKAAGNEALTEPTSQDDNLPF